MRMEQTGNEALPRVLGRSCAAGPVVIQAKPGPLEIDLRRTAIMVIDMQNSFVSKGGFFDILRQHMPQYEKRTSAHKNEIDRIRRLTKAARSKGVKVIYTLSVKSLRGTPKPESPSFGKSTALTLVLAHPEWRDKVHFRGRWGAEIISELTPQEGDILIEKPTYSAFFRTRLHSTLRKADIKYLVFAGIATNICVEATIRDAFYRDYFCVLVSDGTISSGPSFTQKATIFNVAGCYGWVASIEDIIKALV